MIVRSWAYSIYKMKLLLYLFSVIIILIYYYKKPDFSFPIFLIIWVVCGSIICKYTFKDEDFKVNFSIFLFSFTVYLVFTLFSDLLYVSDPFSTFFWTPDSISFYDTIYSYGQYNYYIGPDFFDISSSSVIKGTGINYFGWLISRLSYFIGGGNSIIIHKLPIVWCAAMINVFLYNIARTYFNKIFSLTITLVYSIFSYNLIYSSVLLRDMHVAFLLTIGFYIATKKFNFFNLFILIALAIITWTFRPTHGTFYFLIIFGYVYQPIAKNYFALLMPGLFIVGFITFFLINESYSDLMISRTDNYIDYHYEKVSNSGNAAIIFNNTPTFIHPFIRIAQSQLNVFNFSPRGIAVISNNFTMAGQKQYLTLAMGIADFFWFIVISILFIGLFKKKIWTKIPRKILVLFFIALSLIIMSGFSSTEPRRLLGVYPMIFITFAFVYEQLPLLKRKFLVNIISGIFLFFALLFSILL